MKRKQPVNISTPVESGESGGKQTFRLEVFSDGVFAIAITLLVLELIATLHPHSDKPLLEASLEHWRSFLAFVIGFITILICWINHHVAYEYIRKVDIRLMWINGFLLFVVTLTPFPTAIFAEYLENEGGTAVAFFGFNYILISIAAYSICQYAYRHHLIDEECREFYGAYKNTYLYAIGYTVIAFALCYVSIIIPIIMYAIMFAFFASPKMLARKIYRLKRSRTGNV